MMTNNQNNNQAQSKSKAVLVLILSILSTLIIAASFVVGFIGFNGDSTASNQNTIELTTQKNTIYLLTDEEQNSLLNDVERILKANGVRISQAQILEADAGIGTKLQFVSTTPFDVLQGVCNNEAVQAEIGGLSYFSKFDTSTPDTAIISAHSRVYMPYYEHIWRAAVAIGVVLVVWFVYMAIRFRMAMSLTAAIMLILDGFAMLAVVALTRIPIGMSLMGSLVLTLLFSAFCSTILFANMYRNFRKQDWQDKTLLEATTQTATQNRRLIVIFAATIGIILGGIAIFAGIFIKVAADLFGFALSTFLGLAIVTVNTIFLSPNLFYNIQNSFDSGKIKKGKKVYIAGKELTLKKEKAIE